MKAMAAIVAVWTLLGVMAPASPAQTLLQEGRGTFVAVPGMTFSPGAHAGLASSLHRRVTDRLDLGLLLAYRWEAAGSGYSDGGGHSLTAGPVLGYARALGASAGVRTVLSSHLTYASLAFDGRGPLRLAGYGGRAETFVYRQIRLGGIDLLPSLGVYANLTNFTGSAIDDYGRSRHFAGAGFTAAELRGWMLGAGVGLQVPVAFGIGGGRKLEVVPSYSFDLYNTPGRRVLQPGLTLRLRF